jgi:hypothetical protein
VRFTPDVAAAAAECAPLLTDEVLHEAVAAVPEVWLDTEADHSPAALREAYVARLRARLDRQGEWLPDLVTAAAAGPRIRSAADNRPGWLARRGRGAQS